MSRIPRCVSVIVVTALVFSTGCGPQKLTRGLAKDILNQQGSQKSISAITLSLNQILALARITDKSAMTKTLALMDVQHAKPCGAVASDVRVMVGQLAKCPGYVPQEAVNQRSGGAVGLTKPIGWRIVDVTGISDAPQAQNEKIVEYGNTILLIFLM